MKTALNTSMTVRLLAVVCASAALLCACGGGELDEALQAGTAFEPGTSVPGVALGAEVLGESSPVQAPAAVESSFVHRVPDNRPTGSLAQALAADESSATR